jgi:hypothetical protein
MKLVDQKGRLFGKINLFDLLVILLVVAGLVGIVFRLLLPPVAESNLMTATYTVEMLEQDECFKTAYKAGDTLYEKGVVLGTVTAVQVSPAKTQEILPDGTVQPVEHVTTYDITLTVTTDQLHNSGGYHIGSQEFLAGTTHKISNGYATAPGVVRNLIIK